MGLRVAPLGFDTMMAEWVIDPGSRNLGLKNLAAARLGESMTHIEELIGKGKNQRSMAEVAIAEAAPYAAADAETTLRLKPLLEAELKRFPKLWDLFVEIEMPLVPVLADMEMAGIALDKDFFASFLDGTERTHGSHRETGLRGGRQDLQPQLHPATLGRALRDPAPDPARPGPQNRLRTLFHLGGCAGRDARAAPRGGYDPGIPRTLQAQIHLCGCAARCRSTRRPGACTPPSARRAR